MCMKLDLLERFGDFRTITYVDNLVCLISGSGIHPNRYFHDDTQILRLKFKTAYTMLNFC